MSSTEWTTGVLLTSAEAAALLGVERRTLLRMERAGTLHALRPHPTAQRRYRRSEVMAILGGEAA